MQRERLERIEECNKNERPFPGESKACLAIPLQTERVSYKRWIVKIIAQRMRCQGRSWDQDWALSSLYLRPQRCPCSQTNYRCPQESSSCKQYLLLDINTSFQTLKFISAQMMFMTLGLVILSWILSAKETGLAHGPRHLRLWSEPLLKEYWGQMELICPQVDERHSNRKGRGGWLRGRPGPRREHKIIKWESALQPAANQKPAPKEGRRGGAEGNQMLAQYQKQQDFY